MSKTVFVKVLSGEMITLDVPAEMTRRQFYDQVFYQMPADLAPEKDYQMTLLRVSVVWEQEDGEEGEEKEVGEELLSDNELLEAEDEEMFLAVMDTAKYEFLLNYSWWDACERTREENNLFEVYEYSLNRTWGGVTEVLHDKEAFYHSSEDDTWYSSEGVEYEWVGRFNDELLIEIPEDAVSFTSMYGLALTSLERIPGLSRRARAYLLEEWMNQYEQYMGPYHEDEEENQDEQEIDWDDQGAAWPDNQ